MGPNQTDPYPFPGTDPEKSGKVCHQGLQHQDTWVHDRHAKKARVGSSLTTEEGGTAGNAVPDPPWTSGRQPGATSKVHATVGPAVRSTEIASRAQCTPQHSSLGPSWTGTSSHPQSQLWTTWTASARVCELLPDDIHPVTCT